MIKRLIVFAFVLLSFNCFGSQKTNLPKFTIQESTIESIQLAIKTHQITCGQLIEMYLDRIQS